MMFSTKAEYGVRVMVHLAREDAEEPVSLAAIAAAEGLPLAYLEHLAARLRKANLVGSRRGARGGYSLARPAEAITMAEVVKALEGSIAPVECLTADAEGAVVCAREDEPDNEPCPTKLLWTRVQGSIVRTLTEMTLADLTQPTPQDKTKQTERPAKPARSREAGGRTTSTERESGRLAESREAGGRTTSTERESGRLAEVTP